MKTARFAKWGLISVTAAMVAACGGGGGGGDGGGAATAPAAPTVAVSLAQSKVSVGTPVTLTWSSTDATSCTGMDAMPAGAKPTSGSETITPTAGGQYTYTISCVGAGGTARQSAALVVPIPAAKTSYANWKEIGSTRTEFPAESYIGMGQKAPTAYAWADFFQTGERVLFTANIRYLGNNGTAAADYATITRDPQYHSDFQFWRLNSDKTYTKLWDRKGCKHPRKAIVTDFNMDGVPDLFVACHDIAGELGVVTAGESSVIVMSDGHGEFNITDVPGTTGFYHGAAAADINSDGYPDIALALGTFLINNKNGTFTLSGPGDHRISQAIIPNWPSNYYSIEAVDLNNDGKIDLIAGGDETKINSTSNIGTIILYGDGNGYFNSAKALPSVAQRGIVMDFTVVTNNGVKGVYIGRTSDETSGLPNGSAGTYATNTLQWINLTTLESTVMIDLQTPALTWNTKFNWVPWWIPVTNNGVNGVATYYTFANDELIKFVSH